MGLLFSLLLFYAALFPFSPFLRILFDYGEKYFIKKRKAAVVIFSWELS
jgi:hypothetical protein